MINSKLFSIPAKSPHNFGARLHKIPNCKKVHPLDILKHFCTIAPLFSRVVSSYQEENEKKNTFYLLLQAGYNQSKLALSQQKKGLEKVAYVSP